MKSRIALLTFFFFSVSNSFAQPLKVGVEGGFSFALSKQSVISSTGTSITSTDYRFNARFGLPLQCQLSKKTDLQSGLYYAAKGIDKNPASTFYTLNIAYSTLELPISFVYKIKQNRNRFFIGTGAYLGYAISGKFRFDGSNGQSVKKPVRFGNNPDLDNMKRLDYGLHFQTGIVFQNGLLLRLVVQKQINDMAIDYSSLGFTQIKNQAYAAITMAYLF